MKVIIADDEPYARQRLKVLLGAEPDAEISGECANGTEVADLVEREAVDLIFLDIEMPKMDGFGVMSKLGGSELPLVIFVTAFEQHALRAFEVKAFDYLLKPFEPARLRQTVERARVHLRRLKQDREEASRPLPVKTPPLPTASARDRFAIRNSGRIHFLMATDVDWIEAEHNYVRLHTGSESHLLRDKLSVVEQELDHKQFRRIHRSVIVNIDRIRELRPWFRGDCIVVLQSGKELTMSRTFRESLSDLLG